MKYQFSLSRNPTTEAGLSDFQSGSDSKRNLTWETKESNTEEP